VAWNLRRIRVGRGLSQERLAFDAGVDRSYVGGLERREENPTVDVLRGVVVRLSCGIHSLSLMRKTINKTKIALRAPNDRDWLKGHYQFCNCLAALYLMNSNDSAARLVYVYFFGDMNVGRTCPRSRSEWEAALVKRDTDVGLVADHPLK
jgi:transcriptional regulator with XRE-family HTH domain